VAGGSLRVRLGELREGGADSAAVVAPPPVAADPSAAAPPTLFDQIYLLHPKERRKKV